MMSYREVYFQLYLIIIHKYTIDKIIIIMVYKRKIDSVNMYVPITLLCYLYILIYFMYIIIL